MKIERLEIQDFRGIHEMVLKLDDSMNVLVGENGSGKSTLLDILALMLSWVPARIRRANAPGRHIGELDIRNMQSSSGINISSRISDGDCSWTLGKYRKGRRKKETISDLTLLNKYIESIQRLLDETDNTCSIPLFVYYPTNRAVIEIPLRIRTKHNFDLLEAYDGALTSGANFRTFFEWFRNREDLENEAHRWGHTRSLSGDSVYPDSQLQSVRKALKAMLPEFERFSVRRSPLRMVVYKSGEELWINQLSDGEKCLIAMVGDLARRLAIANPTMENPLTGDGVVLIDEVELHLHVAWQRMIIPKLLETFPGCQFIVTTHSPQVISHVEGDKVILLYRGEDGVAYARPETSYGKNTDRLLEDVLGVDARPAEFKTKLHELFAHIDKGDLRSASAMLNDLQTILGDDPELVKASVLIRRKEAIGK